MKKILCSIIVALMLVLLFIGCTGTNDDPVLPPTRLGASDKGEVRLANAYTFETAYFASNLVAHIKVGDWLGEDNELGYTFFEASVVDIYKGDEIESITLTQQGCSEWTLKGYPLFTSGNELLVFLGCSTYTEYENEFSVIGIYTTVWDAVASDSGEIYYMDRYGLLGEKTNIANNYASDSELAAELYNNAVEVDSMLEGYRFPYIFSKSDVEALINELAGNSR